MTPINTPNWKPWITSIDPDAKLAPPADEDHLLAIESELRVALPIELRGLLIEFDGFTADFGADVVWSSTTILKRNREFRSSSAFRDLYMPFDNLLFFGDDGGGDQFAFAIQADGQIHNPDIFRWEHESDARSWFASGLKQFFERRFLRKR